jgi:hypothetical protein
MAIRLKILTGAFLLLVLVAPSCTTDEGIETDTVEEVTSTDASVSSDVAPTSTVISSTTVPVEPVPTTTSPPGAPGAEEGSVRNMVLPTGDEIPIVTANHDAPAATALTSNPVCDALTPGRTGTTLEWQSAEGGGEQRIDLTVFFRGFEEGAFVATPTLESGQSAYRLLDTDPGAQYEWRILTRSEDGWVTSETTTFRGAVCVIDQP